MDNDDTTIVDPLLQIEQTQQLYSELNPLLFTNNMEGIKLFNDHVTVDILYNMFTEKLNQNSDIQKQKDCYIKYPFGGLFSQLVQYYNAETRVNIYEQMQTQIEDVQTQVEVLRDSDYDFDTKYSMIDVLETQPIQNAAISLKRFVSTINASKRLSRVKENLEATQTYRSHMNIIKIF